MKQWKDMYQNIFMLTQFGLSCVAPLLICLAVCWWLTAYLEVGGWIFLAGFFFGLGGSCMTAYKLYRSVMNSERKKKKKEKVSYNRHF